MKSIKVAAQISLVAALSGCATTSFAPPVVDLRRTAMVTTSPVSGKGPDHRKIRPCESQISYDNNQEGLIKEDVKGARTLINNFLYVYRCRAHGAANGRQSFEVPALLIAGGAATAAAFGAGSGVAIAGGAAGAMLGAGKGYYAPAQKAEIYDHALDALLCIKTEAVDVGAFDLQAQAEQANKTAEKATNPGVPLKDIVDQGLVVTTSQQYFDMVSAALFSVERVLASRLSATGKFDTAGIVAELEALQKKVEAAEADKAAQTGTSTGTGTGTGTGTKTPDATPPKDRPKPVDASPPAPVGTGAVRQLKMDEKLSSYSLELSDSVKALVTAALTPAPAKVGAQAAKVKQVASDSARYVQLDMAIIQPKLQKCVVRAKL